MGRKSNEKTGSHEFGKRLKEFRKSRHWTQAQLAKKIGVDPSMVGSYERGVHYPPVPTLLKLAGELGVSVDRLLGADENKTEDLQDKRLYQLFLKADQADLSKQGLVKEVLESILSSEPAKR